MNEFITSIDLGTSTVCVMISEIDQVGQLQIIGVGTHPCEGIKKGVVVDIESTSMAISYALEQAENMADVEVDTAYINIPGGYTKVVRNKGIIAVSGEDREINSEDVKRVLNSASILSMPQNQQVIDIIPTQYIIDGYDEIKDPIGMVGVRLEADVSIVIGPTTTILNTVKSVNGVGMKVLGIIPEPFAVSESVSNKDERELGVLIIDIGAGTSDFSVFKNNQLIYSDLVPIAGTHMTSDISVGLRISFDESEKIKRKFGVAYTPLASDKSMLKVNPIGIDEKINIPENQLSKIIEARLEEIFEIINEELIKNDLKRKILTGIVLTGGGVSHFKGSKELAEEIFNLPVRLGKPKYVGVDEPIYSIGVGLIDYSLKRNFNYHIGYNDGEVKKNKVKKSSGNGITSFFRRVWDEYF